MKISYQREMKRNYLIVEPKRAELPEDIPFEQKMLEQNQIDGILRFQVRQKDTEIRFFYEITSKQPLARMLEGQTVRAEQLRALVLGIGRAMDHMEQYLLSEKSVLLDPEYLYVDPDNLKVWLCLVPGTECDFPEDYSRLLEYLLGKVDHRDKESVILAYELYQETRKDNYGMEDILRLARQKSSVSGPNHKGSLGLERPEKKDFEMVRTASAEEKTEDTQKPEWKPGMVRASRIRTEPEPEKAGLFGRWKQHWKLRREEKQREMDQAIQMPWETMPSLSGFSNGTETWNEYSGREGRAEEYSAGRRLGKQEFAGTGAAQSSDTILLNGEMAGNNTRVRRLTALDASLDDISISYYPFIIGKQENLVDYVLARETVSRLHLRIDRKEERYYVQDLNSTNGTIVGGHMLENNEIMEIWDGIEISIAGNRYRFE